MTIKEEIIRHIRQEIIKNKLPFTDKEWEVQSSRYSKQGDYATNLALIVGKEEKVSPLELAQKMAKALNQNDHFQVEAVAPGFINFTLTQPFLSQQLTKVSKAGNFKLNLFEGKSSPRIQVEFVSANPTGPLTLGNGRGGFIGDVLANVLSSSGFEVSREYYVNDAGRQILQLGHSVLGKEPIIYKGDYIEKLRNRFKGEQDPSLIGAEAAKIILNDMIKPALQKTGITFDVWFSEQDIYRQGKVEEVIRSLKKAKLIYQQEGAWWLETSRFGDDKDRVMIKSSGEKTYLAVDIAYHQEKFQRGFDKVIDIWGADHYGHIKPVKAGLQALGYKSSQLEVIIVQMVRIIKKGKIVKMSKRSGSYITLLELVEEVGNDAARFFFLNRRPGSHLDFDFDLAAKKSSENPVYYVQYAHARINSILQKIDEQKKSARVDFNLLNNPSETNLIKQLFHYPEIVQEISKDYQVQRLPQYAYRLAQDFHQFYRDCPVVKADSSLRAARCQLLLLTQNILCQSLALMGIEAPKKM